MNLYVFLLSFVTSFSSCTSMQNAKGNSLIKGIRIERLFPRMVMDSDRNVYKVQEYETYYTEIYFYQNKRLIRSNYYSKPINIKEPEDTVLFRTLNRKSVFYTLIYSENSGKVLLIDSNKTEKEKIVNKDSILSNEWVFKVDKGQAFEECNYKLNSRAVDNSGNLIENYFLQNKRDTNITGSLMLTFSKTALKNFEFSLARRLDKERGMKLVKSSQIVNPFYNGGIFVEKMEFPYELKEVEIVNKEELIRLFQYSDRKIK